MKKIVIFITLFITSNLPAQQLNGDELFKFGISKQSATSIMKLKNISITLPDSNTLASLQKFTVTGFIYTGVVLTFAAGKLYGTAYTFDYKEYSGLKTKLCNKYGYKYETEKISETYTTITWGFENGKSVILSMDFENKTGMLQYTDPNI